MQENKLYEALKKIRTIGIVVSILLIILGIVMFTMPLAAALIVSYIFIISIIVSGVFNLLKFVKSPDKGKKVWTLIFALLSIGLGVYVFINDVAGGLRGQAHAIYVMCIALAIMLLTTGFGRITAAFALKKEGGKGFGWMLTSGILDILVGMFFISHPFTTIATYEWVMGIFVIISGITLLIELLSDPPKKEAGKADAAK